MEATKFETGVRKDWTTKAGLRAVVYMTGMGHHCGYVGVPNGHPLHGADYSKPCEVLSAPPDGTEVGKRGVFTLLSAAFDESKMRAPEMVFDVHGGITYSGGSDKYPTESDGLWWFGYDCGHAGDAACPEYLDQQRARYPDQPFMWERYGDEFRDLDYCVAECESLAAQIVAAVPEAA